MKTLLSFMMLLVLVCACRNDFQLNDAVDYLNNSHWDDGKAQVQIYDANLTQYGIKRDASVKMILVKEPFNRYRFVKSNTRISANVVKLNYIRTIPTGMYDYFQMASLFFDVKTGELLKYSLGSQDGCGNTYFEIRKGRLGTRIVYNSYFDDEGRIKKRLPSGVTFYDALPVVLRFKLDKTTHYKIRFITSLIANKYVKPEVVDGTVTITAKELEGYGSVYRVVLLYDGKEDQFYFEKNYPYTLVKWNKAGGDAIRLKRSHFIEYWKYTKNEDRDLIKF